MIFNSRASLVSVGMYHESMYRLHGFVTCLLLSLTGCQMARPPAAPPHASSNVKRQTPIDNKDNGIVLGNAELSGLLWGGDPSVRLELQGEGLVAQIELGLPLSRAPVGYSLDLAQVVGGVELENGRIDVVFAATEPVAMLRCDGVSPQLVLHSPGQVPVLNDAHSLWLVSDTAALVVGWAMRHGKLEIAAAIAAASSEDTSLALARKRVDDALRMGYSGLFVRHRVWWNRFWGDSRVDVPDLDLQARYDLAKYHYGASRRPATEDFWRALGASEDPDMSQLSGVHNMLLGNKGGQMEVFPALDESWQNASFQYLRSEQGHRVSATFEHGRTTGVKIIAASTGLVRIRDPFPEKVALWNADIQWVDGECMIWLEKGAELRGYLLHINVAESDAGS